MKQWRASVATLAISILFAVPASAQWLTIRLPGTPRTPDGMPDLKAPFSRTADGKPDLSGIWRRTRPPAPAANAPNDGIAQGVEVLFQPSAAALYQARADNGGKGMPSERCLPHGIVKATSVPEPFKIVEAPGLFVILHEEFNNYRQIFMDGRQSPDKRGPTSFGYSAGRWEGDALVVETKGSLNDAWLDFRGHPATDALHVTERYMRRDFGHFDIQYTIDDPKAYLKPWTVTMSFDLLPDTELIEHICENEKDATRLGAK